MQSFDEQAKQYIAHGYALFSEADNFLSATQWAVLERTIGAMQYEPVILGDAGEINHLDVARFMTDVNHVKIVDDSSTSILLGIVASARLKAFYRAITGFDEIHIRRAQVNRMRSGSFIGEHVDCHSNPDYAAAVVLQFGKDFSGGDFVVKRERGGEITIKPSYRSAVITRCNLAHRVDTVTAGERTSLVYFLAPHDGANAR